LGVVGAGLTEACRKELDAGMALRNSMIVRSRPASTVLWVEPCCDRPCQGHGGFWYACAWPANPGARRQELIRMSARRCMIDSSCVIVLDLSISCPNSVFSFRSCWCRKRREDLFKRRATRDSLQFFFEAYGFFQRCGCYDGALVDYLLAEQLGRAGSR
jgi:hypothetical protein